MLLALTEPAVAVPADATEAEITFKPPEPRRDDVVAFASLSSNDFLAADAGIFGHGLSPVLPLKGR
jgi:hypothetical protein